MKARPGRRKVVPRSLVVGFPMRLFSFIGFLVTSSFATAACLPSRGTMPANTWHLNDDDASKSCTPEQLADPASTLWSSANAVALETALAAREDSGRPHAVVSVLGCRIDVLPRCHSTTAKAADIEGECTGATHIARDRNADANTSTSTKRKPGEKIDLTPLSLADYTINGTWRGVMRQPHGPYEVYNMTMELTQAADRVSGISRVATVDGEYWGTLRFEGRLEGNTILFADAHVIDDNLGMFLAWCMKGGYLLVDPKAHELRGPWRAGMCNPGTVEVQRIGANNNVLAEATH